jgi:hypothetical protein
MGALFLTYQHYQKDVNERIGFTFKEYEVKVEQLITNYIKRILFILNAKNDHSIILNAENIVICSNNNCIEHDIVLLRAIISQELPKHLECKIYLNNNLVFSNTKKESTKSNFIKILNQIILKTELSISNTYKQQIIDNIVAPYKNTSIFTVIILIISIIITVFDNVRIKKYFQAKYYKILQKKKLAEKQQQWEMVYSKKKDLEINALFSQAISTYILKNQNNNEENFIYQHILINKQTPYSIVLMQQENSEQVILSKLTEDFTARFSLYNISSQNIIFHITAQGATIEFCSRAALYQIIYSVLLYITYITKYYNKKEQSKIMVNISGENNNKILFSIPDCGINSKKDLCSKINDFFSSHCNPFILDIGIVFLLLESYGYECNYENNQLLLNKITQLKLVENNIIHLYT